MVFMYLTLNSTWRRPVPHQPKRNNARVFYGSPGLVYQQSKDTTKVSVYKDSEIGAGYQIKMPPWTTLFDC